MLPVEPDELESAPTASRRLIGVRLREGAWRAPRNVARVRDDYGGESGLVVVP